MNTQMQLPAYIKQANPNTTSLAHRGLMNVGTGSPPYLSIEGGHFTLVDAAGNKKPMPTPIDVCIVDINDSISKCWFGSNYIPNDPTPPICWSDNGIGPSKRAAEPQSSTCAACPKDKWGSKISQLNSEVKECPDHQKVVFIVPGMPGMKFLLRIPGGSFKSWKQYLAKFEGEQVDVIHVVTQIAFDTSQGLSGMLLFRAAGFLDDVTAQEMLKLTNSNETDIMVGRTDVPIASLLAPPQQPSAGIAGGQAANPNQGHQQWPSDTRTQQDTPTGFGQGTANIASPSNPPQGQPQQPARRRGRGRAQAAPGPVAGTQAPFGAPQTQQQFQPAPGPGPGPGPGPVAQPMQQQPFGQPAQAPATAQPQATTFGFAQPAAPPNAMQESINQLFG